MKRNKIDLWVLSLAFCSFLCGRFAYSGSRLELVSTSGGIAAPSFNTSVFQNPAGILNSPGLNLVGQVGLDNDRANPAYKAGFAYGSPFVGLAGGVAVPPSSSNPTSGYYGLAVGAPVVSVGVSGVSQFASGGSTVLHAGLLANPLPFFGLGVNGHDITSAHPEWGGGVHLDYAGVFSLVVDGTFNPTLSLYQVQPGLVLGNSIVAATVSYGMGTGSTQLSTGLAGGVGAHLGPVAVQLYYNQMSSYFASLSIHL